jgi:hypothetical protein
MHRFAESAEPDVGTVGSTSLTTLNDQQNEPRTLQDRRSRGDGPTIEGETSLPEAPIAILRVLIAKPEP